MKPISKEKLKNNKKFKRLSKILMYVYSICMVYSMSSVTAFADNPVDGNGAVGSWEKVMNFIKSWIPKLGGVILFVGAVEFALAFKSEDPEGKTKGVRTAVAGAMIIAIPVGLAEVLK